MSEQVEADQDRIYIFVMFEALDSGLLCYPQSANKFGLSDRFDLFAHRPNNATLLNNNKKTISGPPVGQVRI